MPASSTTTGTTTVQPLTIHLLGNLLTYRVPTADTGGRYAVFDVLTAPGGGAPDHAHEDAEAFVVLDGTYAFRLNGDEHHCAAGAVLSAAGGAVHSFRNIGDSTARMLIITQPGLQHEAFYREAGDEVSSGTTAFPPSAPPDLSRLMQAAARQNMVILPPST